MTFQRQKEECGRWRKPIKMLCQTSNFFILWTIWRYVAPTLLYKSVTVWVCQNLNVLDAFFFVNVYKQMFLFHFWMLLRSCFGMRNVVVTFEFSNVTTNFCKSFCIQWLTSTIAPINLLGFPDICMQDQNDCSGLSV